MDWSLPFSFKGRINRAKFWLVSLSYSVISAILIGIAVWTGSIAAIAVMTFVLLAIAYSGVAIAAKRLHDRDKSGWWLLFFYLLPAILSGMHDALVETGESTAIILGTVCEVIGVAISIWALVELGFRRGTVGPNNYGPDPLGNA